MEHDHDIHAKQSSSLLVLDDEAAIADLVVDTLKSEGLQAQAFYDPFRALKAADEGDFDLAIVDIMMPAMDGFEFLRQIRRFSQIPVVFLTAKDQEMDIVIGFELGADDYITKPFKPRELAARVKARLRNKVTSRMERESDKASVTLKSRGLELDPSLHKASLHDIPLALTPKEFAILQLLMERKGQPVSSKEIYENVWEEPAVAISANTVMVHIRRIRNKLAQIDSSQVFIDTAWGVGYMIAEGVGERV